MEQKKALLESRLEDKSFYHSLFTLPMVQKNAPFSYNLWQTAPQRGIAPLHLLRQLEVEGAHYRLYGFSVSGELTEEQLAQLEQVAQAATVEQITYEAAWVRGFSFLHNGVGGCFQSDYELLPIYRKLQTAYLVIVVGDVAHAQDVQCSYVAYLNTPLRDRYFWCVADCFLEDYTYPTIQDADWDHMEEVPADTELLRALFERLDPEAAITAIGQMKGYAPVQVEEYLKENAGVGLAPKTIAARARTFAALGMVEEEDD